ncbi:flagellin [Devosia sp. YIM 151766]|uniref:flagellin N-terminal helical domain-containing protein n=1 Tax=Devosia sp. YIM 151766 TaxID=3017325 RepID=UPI00255C9A84|nr:flagellin [Devosia sp. YIM 151766]WIY51649.1 flagellin [Devosia sp. YIM 151766]
MSDISLSKAVRSNLLSLQNTADMMAKTQNRLATGNKVNSALDNPTNFFTASSLNSRAGDISQLLDSMANGIQTIEAADNGLKAITKTLESMQSTLRQARQDKSFETGSFDINKSIGSGSISFSGGAVGSEANSFGLVEGVLAGNNGFKGDGGTAGRAGTITIETSSLNSVAVDFGANDTVTDVADKINLALRREGGDHGVSARVEGGQLSLVSSKNESITIGSTGANSDSAVFLGLANGNVSAETAELDGAAITATGQISAFNFTINGQTVNIGNIGHDADATAVPPVAASTAEENAAALATAINNSSVAINAGITVTANGDDELEFRQADGKNFTLGGASISNLGFTGSTATSTGGLVASGDVTTPQQQAQSKTADTLVDEINNHAALKGKIRASNDNGKLRIENLSTQELNVAGATSGKLDGTSAGAKINGNSVRAGLTAQYNELRDQLDKLSDDASFNGINLLRGDNLKLTFNEIGTSEIDIQSKGGKSINSNTLGIRTNVTEDDFDSDGRIDAFLSEIKTAINSVRSQSSAFGSSLSVVQNRQDFSKNMINTLQTGAANLTLADMNEEAANLLALQTRQSLSSSALSMASQADQSVLQLLR